MRPLRIATRSVIGRTVRKYALPPETLADWLLGCITADEATARAYWHRDAITDEEYYGTAYSPTHVLAVCAAHRAIVELHEATHTRDLSGAITGSWCLSCVARPSRWERRELWPCPTLRALAMAYADRPGFREEWRAS